MPTIELTDEQAVKLVEQLPEVQQRKVFQLLAARSWSEWTSLMPHGEAQIRRLAAERSADWDAMNDDERLSFVDDLMHED